MAYLYRGGPQSPRDDVATTITATFSNSLSSAARNPNRMSAGGMGANTTTTPSSDVRAGLTRRFTTNALPTLSPLGLQRKQAMGDYTAMGYTRKTPSESAVRRYETLLAAQRELQRELDKIDPETRREVEEGLRHEESVTQMMASSEPPSPPDYASAFPSAFTRSNRYSMTSLTSPPGIATRPNRSSTQLTSPPMGLARPYTSGTMSSNLPSQSVPGSRRHSDDEAEDDFVYGYEASLHRSAANPNRNSMPITSYDRQRNVDFPSLGPVNTTGFLFDEDKSVPKKVSNHRSKPSATSPPDTKTFLQVQHTADGFPKLIRREDTTDLSSAALDLALSQGVDSQLQSPDRATTARHRVSLPPHALSNNANIAPLSSILAGSENQAITNDRRSLEVKFSADAKRPSVFTSPPRGLGPNPIPKAQSSYSTNDIPTLSSLKNLNGDISKPNHLTSPNTLPSQMVDPTSPQHKMYTSPRNSITRQSIDLSAVTTQEEAHSMYTGAQSSLQANATPFGPTGGLPEGLPSGLGQGNLTSPYAQPPFFGGYNMGVMTNGFANLGFNGGFAAPHNQWQAHVPPMFAPNGFGNYQSMHQPVLPGTANNQRFGENSQNSNNNGNRNMSVAQKRQAHEEALAKFNSVDIAELVGEIYTLCKDQHGCRFLQRKLDEREDKVIALIFDDVKTHIIELMTDPFGNYLCQKLLECVNDDQRSTLIQNAMSAMTKIALNQHGTRALQKMIEYISTPQQTQMIIQALRHDVVQLIQDLNGNHVIQKCLNHLSPQDAQFIFEAVGANCVTVGTHRHGCCVLQRCIDHASGNQKGTLVDQVIANAFALVQDPFGNYVVQYILDLSEPSFTEPLCKSFLGNVVFLSKQKFSSNVIEKCIRCAGMDSKRMLIEEINVPVELDKLLRDSFANYVVQTAMDYGDEETKAALVDNVRPILPAIRHTPYGRRIQSKLQDYDNRKGTAVYGSRQTSGTNSGMVTPPDVSKSLQSNGNVLPFAAQAAPAGRGNRSGFVGPSVPVNGLSNANSNAHGLNGTPGSFNHANNAFGSNAFHDMSLVNNNNIVSPTPQRHNQNNAMLSNQQMYYKSGTNGTAPAYGMDRQAPPYSQF